MKRKYPANSPFFAITFIALLFASGCGSSGRGPAEASGYSVSPDEHLDTRFRPAAPRLGTDLFSNLADFADFMRNDRPDLDPYLDDPSLTAVTQEFGESVLSVQSFPYRSDVAAATIHPWSSWWFPKRENTLFGDPSSQASSALGKYDLVRAKRSELAHGPKPASSADFERKNYNPTSLSWEGLCDAWALASVSMPEPKKPVAVKIGGVVVNFSVGELKGLLLKTYEAVDDRSLSYYGQKFTGDYRGWIFPDIFPEQFHRFLEVKLLQAKENERRPFIMDHDPGIEVWNTPVYKVNFLMDTIPNQPDSVFVRTWLYTAESVAAGEKDFVGTKEGVREYDYVLLGSRDASKNLHITSGYWVKGPGTVDSRQDHPDYLTVIRDPSKLVRKSWNPEIDVKLVDEILAGSL
jgi:hypothetical protein